MGIVKETDKYSSFTDDYVLGVWRRQDLARQLLWRRQITQDVPLVPDNPGLPTWCWAASAGGKVWLWNLAIEKTDWPSEFSVFPTDRRGAYPIRVSSGRLPVPHCCAQTHRARRPQTGDHQMDDGHCFEQKMLAGTLAESPQRLPGDYADTFLVLDVCDASNNLGLAIFDELCRPSEVFSLILGQVLRNNHDPSAAEEAGGFRLDVADDGLSNRQTGNTTALPAPPPQHIHPQDPANAVVVEAHARACTWSGQRILQGKQGKRPEDFDRLPPEGRESDTCQRSDRRKDEDPRDYRYGQHPHPITPSELTFAFGRRSLLQTNVLAVHRVGLGSSSNNSGTGSQTFDSLSRELTGTPVGSAPGNLQVSAIEARDGIQEIMDQGITTAFNEDFANFRAAVTAVRTNNDPSTAVELWTKSTWPGGAGHGPGMVGQPGQAPKESGQNNAVFLVRSEARYNLDVTIPVVNAEQCQMLLNLADLEYFLATGSQVYGKAKAMYTHLSRRLSFVPRVIEGENAGWKASSEEQIFANYTKVDPKAIIEALTMVVFCPNIAMAAVQAFGLMDRTSTSFTALDSSTVERKYVASQFQKMGNKFETLTQGYKSRSDSTIDVDDPGADKLLGVKEDIEELVRKYKEAIKTENAAAIHKEIVAKK
ncbi:hypothetical protein B0T24DRAFT_721316 [Lasiosphaeria ovina]|uniref:Uncharacterized protein n=1 Tax=Lasiosphaeria ovina TaxID=92902 RepID=A0AAE0K771_9PEZI|nr:hypothetical protein B0T24DRAFT_721316 [Lasiosphaeria ovina]